MYQSKESLVKGNLPKLKQYLSDFLVSHKSVRCKALKGRRIFFDKLPKIITQRKDASGRLKCFFVAIDILKKSHYFTERMNAGNKEYEMFGFSGDGKKVFIHFREEEIKKDKRLIFISTYYKK